MLKVEAMIKKDHKELSFVLRNLMKFIFIVRIDG